MPGSSHVESRDPLAFCSYVLPVQPTAANLAQHHPGEGVEQGWLAAIIDVLVAIAEIREQGDNENEHPLDHLIAAAGRQRQRKAADAG